MTGPVHPVVVVDVDGVLYDFVDQIGHVAAARTGRPRHHFGPAQCWEFYETQWGLSTDEFLALFADGVRDHGLLADGDPFAGARSGWQTLRAAGASLHIATDCSPPGAAARAQANRGAWLARHGFVADSVQFTRDKAGACATVAQGLDRPSASVWMVEDRVENVVACDAAGFATVLVDRPWNARLDHPRRVPHFAAAAALILGTHATVTGSRPALAPAP